MGRTFPETLSLLRRQRNISQRQAAAELCISQALLSHYENAREPGWALYAARATITASARIIFYAARRSRTPRPARRTGGRVYLRPAHAQDSAEASFRKNEGKHDRSEAYKKFFHNRTH